jgi:hypothetical protein
VAIRGPSAKGLDCVSGARVRIPLSPYGTKKPVALCSRFLFLLIGGSRNGTHGLLDAENGHFCKYNGTGKPLDGTEGHSEAVNGV